MNYFLLYKKCLLNIKAQVFSGVHNNCSVFILFGVNDRQVRSVKDNKFVLYYYLVLWRKKIEELKFAWKIIQIDIRDTDSYSDSYSLFSGIYHSNLLFNKDSYQKSLSALEDP